MNSTGLPHCMMALVRSVLDIQKSTCRKASASFNVRVTGVEPAAS